MTIKLDPTSDSAAVLVWASPADVEALGGSIVGSTFEGADDGDLYAMVGLPWNDELSSAENNAEFDTAWEACAAEVKAAGLNWKEI